MTNIHTLEDIATLSETIGLEYKLAAGRDGKGHLPADFWPTYSAFANSRGGIILLGVQEKQGRFSLHGVDQPERIITDLFNTVNNPQKVNVNLLSDQDVSSLTIEGKSLVTVSVPAAHRKQKPVYLNGNPFRVPIVVCMMVTAAVTTKPLNAWWPNRWKTAGTAAS